MVTINGMQFLGGGALSQNNSATLNDCMASCSSNPQCTGATYNPTNYKQPMCFLRKGDGNVVNGLSSDIAIVPKGKQLLSIVQSINQQLNETNNPHNILFVLILFSLGYTTETSNGSYIIDILSP